MTTLAQFLFISAYPDKSHNFQDNEEFEQFRDNLLLTVGLTPEKVDKDIETNTTRKEERLSEAAICRRSHKVIRRAIVRKKINLLNIQRFLLNKLYELSKDLEEAVDEELESEWELQIQPHLQNKSTLKRFLTLLGVFAKVLTLSEAGKTMVSYLKSGGKDKELSNEFPLDESEESDDFTIPETK
jgi:hypothetical protein